MVAEQAMLHVRSGEIAIWQRIRDRATGAIVAARNGTISIEQQLSLLRRILVVAASVAMLVELLAFLYSIHVSDRAALLHGRAIAVMTMEKDLASLERDIFRAALHAHPSTVAAAKANIGDLKRSFQNDRGLAEDQKGFLDIRRRAEMFALESETVMISVEAGRNQDAHPTLHDLAQHGETLDKAIEGLRDELIFEAARLDERSDIVSALCAGLGLVGGLVAVLVALLLGKAIGKGIIDALERCTHALRQLAAGNYDIEIDGAGRSDSIGDLARSALLLREVGREKNRLREERKRALATAAKANADAAERRRMAEQEAARATERATTRRRVADEFEHSLFAAVASVATSASQLSGASTALSKGAGDIDQRAARACSAAERIREGVEGVALNSRHIATVIEQAAASVSSASRLSETATSKADAAEARIHELSAAATGVAEIVDMISAIATKTKLLSLNATIEAARAGETGRGFAVVASEVRSLAGQTMVATENIAAKVGAMHAAAVITCRDIRGIVEANDEVRSVADAIFTTIVNESATSARIAEVADKTVLDAIQSFEETEAVLGTVRATLGDISEIDGATQALAKTAATLKEEAGVFLAGLEHAEAGAV